MSDPYSEAVEKIVKEQETIMGPLALEQAHRVNGLDIDLSHHKIEFKGNKSEIIDRLVGQYQKLFGQTSVQVCKDAALPFLSNLPPQDIPSTLQ